MFRELLTEMKVTYALTSDDNLLANMPKEIMMDLEDQFGNVIDDYDLEMADSNKPKITITYTRKGDKLHTKIAKELKKGGYIK